MLLRSSLTSLRLTRRCSTSTTMAVTKTTSSVDPSGLKRTLF
jgi:hypothetical protein